MRSVLSAVVSHDDLKKYFTGEHWKLQEADDGSVEAKSEAYLVKLAPKSKKFDVSIAATDDPSDAETKKTSDPVAFISKFLETGTEADDVLKKMSFHLDPWTFGGNHAFMMEAMWRMASMLEAEAVDSAHVQKVLRRATVLMLGQGIRRVVAAAVRSAAGQAEEKEIQGLLKEMKAKGWKVGQEEDDDGKPVVSVDVSGIYQATIKLDEINWGYSFEVNDIPESKEEGDTTDPIQQFRLFYKKDSTQDAKKELKLRAQSKQEEGTAPAAPIGKKRKEEQRQELESGQTEMAPETKRRQDLESGSTEYAPTPL